MMKSVVVVMMTMVTCAELQLSVQPVPSLGEGGGGRSTTWILLPILSSVPSEHVLVTAKFGDSVTLPCDGGPYILGIPEDTLHVFWETLDYRVYEFMGGKGYPDNGFQNRAEMSQEKISRGDFSLTVHHTTFSDGQIYKCYLIADKLHLLQWVDLAVLAHRVTVTLQPGAFLSVPLLTGEPVEVLFDPAGAGDSTSVCSVQNSTASCVPQYRDRVSVQNSSLTLCSLTPAEQGSYTVRDLQGNTISTVTVTVEGRARVLSYLIPVLTVLSALGVLAGLYYKKKEREPGGRQDSAVRDGDDGETGEEAQPERGDSAMALTPSLSHPVSPKRAGLDACPVPRGTEF